MRLLTERQGARAAALGPICEAVKDHLYGAEILERLGFEKAAAVVRTVLPVGKQIRSGDLGEIIATEYIVRRTGFRVPVKRLRYKDDRKMSMRGDDVVGLSTSPGGVVTAGSGRPRVLKAEVKSYAALTPSVVKKACAALESDGGRPKPSTLAFLAHKLRMTNADADAEVIEDFQERPPRHDEVAHFVFTMSGNDPTSALAGYTAASGPVAERHLVGLRVDGHQAFVASVFDAILAAPVVVVQTQTAATSEDPATPPRTVISTTGIEGLDAADA